MQADTQRATEQPVDYDFFTVKCGKCETESSAVLYKQFGSFDGDGLLAYIEEATGYTPDKEVGGMKCSRCVRNSTVTAMVDGRPVNVEVSEQGEISIDLKKIMTEN